MKELLLLHAEAGFDESSSWYPAIIALLAHVVSAWFASVSEHITVN